MTMLIWEWQRIRIWPRNRTAEAKKTKWALTKPFCVHFSWALWIFVSNLVSTFVGAFVVSVATSAEPCGEKQKTFFVRILGGEKPLEKCHWTIFKRPERGLKKIVRVTFWIVFRIIFHVIQTVFRVKVFFFSGAVSFCRRAALIKCRYSNNLHVPSSVPPPSFLAPRTLFLCSPPHTPLQPGCLVGPHKQMLQMCKLPPVKTTACLLSWQLLCVLWGFALERGRGEISMVSVAQDTKHEKSSKMFREIRASIIAKLRRKN